MVESHRCLAPDAFEHARQDMVEHQLRARGIRDTRLLNAFLRVPRHLFVPEAQRHVAYSDRPLPIGEGQTISQPYIVAEMLAALSLLPTDKVLDIGVGSGYQTALLCELVEVVFGVERFASLAERAEQILRELQYTNVQIVVGDGSEGLPGAAPFDAISVAAAAPDVPPALVDQLAEGGRLILPVGDAEQQHLALVRKELGRTTIEWRQGCRFVSLIGRGGFHE